MLENIRIVLVNTTHPGNIGSAARAMKTMGLMSLYLVAPEMFPHAQATAQASGADDVLEKAVVVSSFEEAIVDCHLIFGTSTRTRKLAWDTEQPRQSAIHALATAATGQQVAIVFGQERTGLTNEQLARCHCQIEIPANPVYSSLNLAAAVQVISYELYLGSQNQQSEVKHQPLLVEKATGQEMALFYEHLQQVLQTIDFLKPTSSAKLFLRLQRLFNRASPDQQEMNILRGILTAVQQKIEATH